MSDGFLVIDSSGCHISVNDAFCQMTGFSAGELVGNGPPHPYWPEEEYSHIQTAFEATMRKEHVNASLIFKKKNGKRFPVLVSAFPVFDKDGQVESYAATIKDLSDQLDMEDTIRKNNAKYKTLFENLNQGVVYQRADGKIVDVNDAALMMLGLNRDQFLGKDSYDPRWKVINEQYEILAPECHPSMKALKTGKKIIGETIGIYVPEKRGYNWLIVNAVPIFHENTELPDEVFVTFEDITARKKAEEALLESEAELREINSTKDKFFSIIAHDLRNPFNSILGLSEILVEQIAEKDYNDLDKIGHYIFDSSKKAMDLLMNLLTWARSKTGKIEYQPTYLQAETLFGESMETVRAVAEAKGVQVEMEHFGAKLVYADKEMISTVLRNLISNAIKFSYAGSKVVLSTKYLQSEVLIAVKDEGVGMNEDMINSLFRIDSAQTQAGTNREKGTGLGLILCKEFIDRHKGKIWVESSIGKGTTVFFTLPAE